MKTKENIGPLLNTQGNPVMDNADKGEVFNACFFT